MQASKEGKYLTDFRYSCIGYSVYLDQKARSADGQGVQTELPLCAGLEVCICFLISFIPSLLVPCYDVFRINFLF